MPAPVLSPPDPRLAPFLTAYPPDLFSERFHWSCELVDRYASACAVEVARILELERALAQPATLGETLERAGCVPAFAPALRWLLERLSAEGHVASGGDRFRWTRALASSELAGLAELRQRALDVDSANHATLALFDAATAAYPAVARGTASGEALLFGLGQIGLWVDYFSAGNPVYAVNNRLAAHAAARALAASPRPELRILEVGAGAGSGTLALIGELDRCGLLGRVVEYTSSEPSAFFRRRAERVLRARFPDVALRFTALDIDQDWAAQGAPAGSFDLVLGVNVFHVARRLVAALEQARRALAPDGALVVSECLRLWPRQPVANEFPFLLLDGFTRVEIEPELRPEPGFLEPAVWRRALERAGFVSVEIEPDLDRIRDIHPRFNTGALTARAG
ncbi:MAG: class I SAM-dependent methyltransferase [Acidobacteriota bacterium]